jgi:hypothetical protein
MDLHRRHPRACPEDLLRVMQQIIGRIPDGSPSDKQEATADPRDKPEDDGVQLKSG